MWFSSQIRFPYPVLSAESDDYVTGKFTFEFTASEILQTGEVEVAYRSDLDQAEFAHLLEEGDAVMGLFIDCPTTYFSRLFDISFGPGSLLLAAGNLRGRVTFRPVIYTTSSTCTVPNCAIHNEFGNSDWDYGQFQFLAIGEQQVINVGLEKLAPMETIFTLAKDDELNSGEVKIQLDSEKIRIVVNDETFKKVHNLRSSRVGKTVLLNGLYLPVVMSLMDTLSSGPEGFDDRRWHQVFTAKCELLGVDTQGGEILANAQKLLKLPLQRLLDLKELGI